MTHAELQARIEDGLPFTLHVADGRSYHVPHRDFIWLPPRSTVTVIAVPSPENELETVSHTIPLLMVSGISQTIAGTATV
jgi:hypothetical protein